MKQGAYFARVTGDRVYTVFADEDAVRDAQMCKLFAARDKDHAEQQRQAAEKQHMADRQALKKARKFRTTAKECLWLTATAALVYCTYLWGIYVAVAAVTGCMVALGCRIIHYITTKEKEKEKYL